MQFSSFCEFCEELQSKARVGGKRLAVNKIAALAKRLGEFIAYCKFGTKYLDNCKKEREGSFPSKPFHTAYCKKLLYFPNYVLIIV